MQYFPLGLAEGKAFCNRVAERKKLKQNIDTNRCTIVTSPRRYGKSSLVLYVLSSLKIPHARVDLFVTLDESTVAREIIDGANRLINQVFSQPESLIQSIKGILKTVSTKWSIGISGINLELTRTETKDDALAIRDILIILDKILSAKKRKAVFFVDEFQEIGVVANSKGIEGAIRSVAEQSKNLIFIFSGSNRHVLSSMFDDRSRPLYMLCDKIILDRMSEKDYINFIDKAAKKRWNSSLSQQFYEILFDITERHPYYVNLVCGRIYAACDSLPASKEVISAWEAYLREEKSKIALELSKLSLIQKKVMIAVASGQHVKLTSKELSYKMSATTGAISKSIKSLIAKDYLYEDEQLDYRIVDPLIRSSIQHFFPADELMQ